MTRSMSQRMQDDEDHRLALCGLTPDVRLEYELEDQASRHYDFIFAALAPSRRGRDGGFTTPQEANAGSPSLPSQIFASGRRDPAPLDAKRAQGVGGGPVRTGVSRALRPPPTSTT